MKNAWKIAALLAACGALGLTGCAGDTGETAPESVDATASLDAPQIANEAADEDTSTTPESLILAPERQPPICPGGTRRVRYGGGYRCEGPGFNPPPICPRGWRLIGVRLGWMCERHHH